ncbi:hypothetical protein ACVBIL_05955 [Shewanella sp. 125m-7]
MAGTFIMNNIHNACSALSNYEVLLYAFLTVFLWFIAFKILSLIKSAWPFKEFSIPKDKVIHTGIKAKLVALMMILAFLSTLLMPTFFVYQLYQIGELKCQILKDEEKRR